MGPSVSSICDRKRTRAKSSGALEARSSCAAKKFPCGEATLLSPVSAQWSPSAMILNPKAPATVSIVKVSRIFHVS